MEIIKLVLQTVEVVVSSLGTKTKKSAFLKVN